MKKTEQLALFDTIWEYLWPQGCSFADEEKQKFILLFCIIWSYSKFRRVRPTQTDNQFFNDLLHVNSVSIDNAKGLYILPACDFTAVGNQSLFESRFIAKVRRNLPKKVQNDFHQIIRDYDGCFSEQKLKQPTILAKPYIHLKYLIPSIFLALFQISKNFQVFKSSWSITCTDDYLAIFRALVIYYSNLSYFRKIFLENNNIEFVVVSNFYSPENLALIAISNEFKLTSFDIQHGVQKNVIAYERLNRFPMSLRPTEIVKWVDEIPTDMDGRMLYREFCATGIRRKKCLVTLQPSNSDIFLDELNLLSDEGMEIVVRPHPRRNGEAFLDKLSKNLRRGICIRSYTDITDEFSDCDIHLSEYSSALLESASARVLSVALHNTALVYMCDEIRDGKILHFPSIKDFIRATKEL